MSDRDHWEEVYRKKVPTEVSWYRAHLDQSLALIAMCELPADANIVDVGGGASTLVDDLIALGHTNISVVDIAAGALEESQRRLGDRGARVRWIQGDARTPLLEQGSVDLWHDRAVFHFLVSPADRDAYVAQVLRATRPGSRVLIGAFALDGPERCSGLPVARYSADAIVGALGPQFVKIAQADERHETPWGTPQRFSYALCERGRGSK